MVNFIKEHSVDIFMSRTSVQAGGGGEAGSAERGSTASAEEAMMGRMGVLVVCRFERLVVEEQVSMEPNQYFALPTGIIFFRRY